MEAAEPGLTTKQKRIALDDPVAQVPLPVARGWDVVEVDPEVEPGRLERGREARDELATVAPRVGEENVRHPCPS